MTPMPDPDDLSLKQFLRDGLQSLPVPAVAFDFDDRVLASLRASRPWPHRLWALVWEPARPLLLGASCSLAVTLLLLHWTLSAPVATPDPALSGTLVQAQTVAPARALSLDALLNRPGLRAGSLSAAWENPLAPNNGGTRADPPPGRPPDPMRHAQIGGSACLIV